MGVNKELFEVTYTVSAVIAADDLVSANFWGIKQFMEIIDCHSYDKMDVVPLPVKHNWVDMYVPFGSNLKGLTISQIEHINKKK